MIPRLLNTNLISHKFPLLTSLLCNLNSIIRIKINSQIHSPTMTYINGMVNSRRAYHFNTLGIRICFLVSFPKIIPEICKTHVLTIIIHTGLLALLRREGEMRLTWRGRKQWEGAWVHLDPCSSSPSRSWVSLNLVLIMWRISSCPKITNQIRKCIRIAQNQTPSKWKNRITCLSYSLEWAFPRLEPLNTISKLKHTQTSIMQKWW